MPICPVCSASIPDEFGLLECGSCGAQLLVHMDGRVEHSGAVVLGTTESAVPEGYLEEDPPRTSTTAEKIPTQLLNLGELEIPESELAGPDLHINTATHATALPPELRQQTVVTSTVVATKTQMHVPPSTGYAGSEEILDDLLDDSSEPPSPIASANSLDSPDLSDIGRFANSEASAVGEGTLRYNLYVSGIDTSDVRSHFREAITDKKMMWDTEAILRSIQNGEVKIAGISAVKAHMLVSRLRNLPVKIRWEQYALSQS